jgi:NAD-dependent dihydropyrimidine dehydrogenase PreA subunit
MPIIINHNLCDEAPECGGIEVCPTGAFYYDKKRKRVAIDHSKCNECLKCTLPDACPVGCILYARDKKEEARIQKILNQNPRTTKWLWQERYGCQPGKTPPKAKILNKTNTNNILKQRGYKLIDIWHYDYLDCRAHSVLFKELLKGIKEGINIYKLDAKKYPKFAKILKVNKFPTLLLYNDKKEIWRFEGLMKDKQKKELNTILGSKVKPALPADRL